MFSKKIGFLLLLSIYSYAKEDYIFSFVDSNLQQISIKKKQKLNTYFEKIDYIKTLVFIDEIQEAYKEIELFNNSPETKKYSSFSEELILLEAKTLYLSKNKEDLLKAYHFLKENIFNSKLKEDFIQEAYLLFIDINLKMKNYKEANIILNNLQDVYNSQYLNSFYFVGQAKILSKTGEIKKAINILEHELGNSKDLKTATNIAYSLFDLYIQNKDNTKAFNLLAKVFNKNNNVFFKENELFRYVDKFNDLKMHEFSIVLLEDLTNNEDIFISEKAKFELAKTYLDLYNRLDTTHTNFEKAYNLLLDFFNSYPNSRHNKEIKLLIDELLLRKGEIKPETFIAKYSSFEDQDYIHNLALFQELLNLKQDKSFDIFYKQKKIYIPIPNNISYKFGYTNMEDIFTEFDKLYFLNNLDNSKCEFINQASFTIKEDFITDIYLDKNKTRFNNLLLCLESDTKNIYYDFLKKIAFDNNDLNLLFILEKHAINKGKFNDVENIYFKLTASNNKEILIKEFFNRFEYFLNNKKDKLNEFFLYFNTHKYLEEPNSNNPMIIDFYYYYYLYLKSIKQEKEAELYLLLLYQAQKQHKVYIYSSFVNMELHNNYYEEKDFETSKLFLLELLENQSIFNRLSNEDLAKIYYKLFKTFDLLQNKLDSQKYITLCKSLSNISDNMYFLMCSKL